MQENKHFYTNRLIHENSPYLLLHAHNPVDWYAWGDDALKKAKDENKLIIISIGYAACHWCHVMEHESFSDEGVAKVMNKHFVSIKVDREERPDIDQIYMNAAQVITGRGGWPLNVIALPDGRPVYAGTYFTKTGWLSLLDQIQNLFEKEPDKIIRQADAVTRGIEGISLFKGSPVKENYSFNDLKTITDNWKKRFDPEWGGQKGAPKFPMPIGLNFLINYYSAVQDNEILDAVKTTLDRMSRGGIYDQVGGGFSRYSVDGFWKVPHFEKMLYDNAQLASIFSKAWQVFHQDSYKQVVYQTLDFVERELLSDAGGFYSSIDADSKGEEGEFYVWREQKMDSLLGENSDIIKSYYGVTKEGNWEDSKNVLFRLIDDNEFSSINGIEISRLKEIVAESKKILFNERSKRTRPAADTKILTAWNSLMIKGFVDAFKAFHDQRFFDSAVKTGQFIVNNMMDDDFKLKRNFTENSSQVDGFLDDYALTIDAFIAMYTVTFDESWLYTAKNLTDYAIKHFYDSKRGLFLYTSDIDSPLIVRNTEVMDNVIPSSNSVMANNLFILSHYFGRDDFTDKAEKMMSSVLPLLREGGVYFANWDLLLLRMTTPLYEIEIIGKDALEKKVELDNFFLPDVILSGSTQESSLVLLKDKFDQEKTKIYICENKTCYEPVETMDDVLNLIGKSHLLDSNYQEKINE